MELRIFSHTDQGKRRDQNEDALLTDPPLVAVADGMGGHVFGEVAAALALEVLGGAKDKLESRSGHEASDVLREAFRDANRAVSEKGREDEKLLGMGTTLTAAWIDGNTASLAHVGDSRAYLLRGDKLEQLTQDQTVADEWVRRGKLTREEAATSPHRNVLLQAIGTDNELDIETLTVELHGGDRLLLMSDGLYGMVRDDVIRGKLLEQPDGDAACRALIDAANDAGGQDNITVVIVDVVGDDPDAGGVAAPVVVDRGETAREPRPPAGRASRTPRSALVAGGAVLLLAVMAVVFLVRPTSPTYVISMRGGNIVVLDGRPGRNDEPAPGEVVKVFRDEKVAEFPTTVQRELRSGIVVDTLREAESVIEQLPRKLGPQDTPTPEPEGSPSPTVKVSPSPKPKT